MNDSTRGWPTLKDIEQEYVFRDEELIKRANYILTKYKYCLIRGAEGRGKTVLARIIANDKHNEKWKVRFCDIGSIKDSDIDYIFKQIKQVDDEKTIIIIENSNTSLDKIIPHLIKFITIECKFASFIFTYRKIIPAKKELFIENPFEIWEENGWYVDINPDLNTTMGVIKKFIAVNNINYRLTKQDEFWINNRIGIENEQIGVANLRRLHWYLITWKENGGKLHDIEKHHVLEKILKDVNNLDDDDMKEMLLKISGVYQFDVNFYGKNYNNKSLSKLTRTGIISASPGYYFRLQHSTDAAHIIEAEASLKAMKDIDIVTTDILIDYLSLKPENYQYVLKALYDNKKRNILLNIYKDENAYKYIFNLIVNDTLQNVILHLLSLNLIFSEEKALKFWHDYKNYIGNSEIEQKNQLQNKLSNTPLTGINFLLSLFKKKDIDEKNWLVNEVLDEKILTEKVNSSSISVLDNFFRYLPETKIQSIISGINIDELVEKSLNSKTNNAQKITWTLRYLVKDKSNKEIANSFLLAIYERGKLVTLLKNSDFKVIIGFLDEVKFINPYLYKKIISSISPFWLQLILSSNLNIIMRQLQDLCFYKNRWKFGNPEKSAELIVRNLALKDLSDQIHNLFNQKENQNQFKILGKLLSFSYRISNKTDKYALEKIALQIVNNIDFNQYKNYTMSEVYHLAYNVKNCSTFAWKKLCKKIISEQDLTEYIKTPICPGLSGLILQLYRYDEEFGQELSDKIFHLDINNIIIDTECEVVSQTIRDMFKIDPIKTIKWVKNFNNDCEIDLELLKYI